MSEVDRISRKRCIMEEAFRFLSYLMVPEIGCTELLIKDARQERDRWIRPGGQYASMLNGYFDDPEDLMDAANWVDGVSAYISINPLKKDLMARKNSNGIGKMERGGGTAKEDVAVIRMLLIDIDPVRPSGISSTKDEYHAALDRRDQILAEVPGLRQSSLWGTSGNGGLILVKLPDLEPSPENLKKTSAFGKSISSKFTDKTVRVEGISNPAGHVALCGTYKSKGTHTAERPWRLARLNPDCYRDPPRPEADDDAQATLPAPGDLGPVPGDPR
jgi:hypothetical protein